MVDFEIFAWAMCGFLILCILAVLACISAQAFIHSIQESEWNYDIEGCDDIEEK